MYRFRHFPLSFEEKISIKLDISGKLTLKRGKGRRKELTCIEHLLYSVHMARFFIISFVRGFTLVISKIILETQLPLQ